MIRFRQDLGEQPDVVELPGLEAGNVDGKVRVDQPAGGSAAEPDARPGGGRGRGRGRQRQQLRGFTRGADLVETKPRQ